MPLTLLTQRSQELFDLTAYLIEHKKAIAKELLQHNVPTPVWAKALDIIQTEKVYKIQKGIAKDLLFTILLEDLVSQPDEPQKITPNDQTNTPLKDLLDPL